MHIGYVWWKKRSADVLQSWKLKWQKTTKTDNFWTNYNGIHNLLWGKKGIFLRHLPREFIDLIKLFLNSIISWLKHRESHGLKDELGFHKCYRCISFSLSVFIFFNLFVVWFLVDGMSLLLSFVFFLSFFFFLYFIMDSLFQENGKLVSVQSANSNNSSYYIMSDIHVDSHVYLMTLEISFSTTSLSSFILLVEAFLCIVSYCNSALIKVNI